MMDNINMPKTLDFGFGDIVEVSYLENIFGISRRAAFKYLRAMGIEPLYIGDDTFFNLMTLKRILFVLSKPNAPGFIFPGSSKKNDSNLKKKGALTKVTDEILEQAARPETLSEMAAASGRNESLLKQFVTRPVGRPKKNETN